MDVFVVTETWLTSKDRDKGLMKASELNRNNYRLMTLKGLKGKGVVWLLCIIQIWT